MPRHKIKDGSLFTKKGDRYYLVPTRLINECPGFLRQESVARFLDQKLNSAPCFCCYWTNDKRLAKHVYNDIREYLRYWEPHDPAGRYDPTNHKNELPAIYFIGPYGMPGGREELRMSVPPRVYRQSRGIALSFTPVRKGPCHSHGDGVYYHDSAKTRDMLNKCKGLGPASQAPECSRFSCMWRPADDIDGVVSRVVELTGG